MFGQTNVTWAVDFLPYKPFKKIIFLQSFCKLLERKELQGKKHKETNGLALPKYEVKLKSNFYILMELIAEVEKKIVEVVRPI